MRLSGLFVLAALMAGLFGCGGKAAPAPPESRILGRWQGNLSREIDNKRFVLDVEFTRTHQGILALAKVTDREDGRVYKRSSYAEVADRQVGPWAWTEEVQHDGSMDRRWVNDRRVVNFRITVPDFRDLEPRNLMCMGIVEKGGILWGTYQTNHNEDLGTWRMESAK